MLSVSLETSRDVLTFDRESGRLVSMRPHGSPDAELLASCEDDPAFVLQYLDASGRYCALDSREAEAVTVTPGPVGRQSATFLFSRAGGLDLDVSLTVRTDAGDRFSRWSATVRNGCGLRIVDLQSPFVVVPHV